jgi:hypothetical protein
MSAAEETRLAGFDGTVRGGSRFGFPGDDLFTLL